MNPINYPIYIFFGLAPSIVWLLFFLRKDSHPESNRMILKVFFLGMAAAIPTALIQIGFAAELKTFNLPPFLFMPIYVFLGIALIEETFKYLAARIGAYGSPELDEPIDIMLYMVVSALGFAALENLLILLPYLAPFQLIETFVVSSFRFVGATFLHALVSGLVGYFVILSFRAPRKKTRFLIAGLSTAALLHGLYNLSIMKIDNGFKFAIPIAILIGLLIFIIFIFKKVGKLKSVCLQK